MVRCLGCFSFEELPVRLLFNICKSWDELKESVGDVGDMSGGERSGEETRGDVWVGVVSLDLGTSFDSGFKFASDVGFSLFVLVGLSERKNDNIRSYFNQLSWEYNLHNMVNT